MFSETSPWPRLLADPQRWLELYTWGDILLRRLVRPFRLSSQYRKDIFQNVWLDLLITSPDWLNEPNRDRLRARLCGWLTKVLRSKVTNWCQQQRPHTPLENVVETGEEPTARDLNPEEQLMCAEAAQGIWHLLRRLANKDRNVLAVLLRCEEKSTEEIAQILNVPAERVRDYEREGRITLGKRLNVAVAPRRKQPGHSSDEPRG